MSAPVRHMQMTKLTDQFTAQLHSTDSQVLADVCGFVDWQTGRQGRTFRPDAADDVAIRSYLLHLKLSGARRAILERAKASLKRFYAWAQASHLIAKSPFDSFDFSRPLLTREQIKRREEGRFANPTDREIGHLRALNHLAEHLNRSVDVGTLLTTVVRILAQAIGLKTAWAFLWTEAGLHITTGADDSPHDFALAACCGLPPGLDRDHRSSLCQPPDCHCQRLLRNGQLVRAVNVVECTRLQHASRHAGETEGLLFHASVPLIVGSRPAGLINIATERWEFLNSADLQFVSAAASQVGIALERARWYDLAEAQRTRLEQELEMARVVQKSLLPAHPPSIPSFTLAADWRPAREVAGDFYDFFPLPDGCWGLVLADVSGKGAPAALYMAMARSLIRSEACRHSSASAALTEVNRRLLLESSNEMFITVFYAILDPVRRSLNYANAGHPPPFLRRSSRAVTRLAEGGPLMGLFEQWASNDETLHLESGDTLVAYTDGLTDVVNRQGEDYGHGRLAEIIDRAPPGAQEALAHILKNLEIFAGAVPQPDDITLLILTCD